MFCYRIFFIWLLLLPMSFVNGVAVELMCLILINGQAQFMYNVISCLCCSYCSIKSLLLLLPNRVFVIFGARASGLSFGPWVLGLRVSGLFFFFDKFVCQCVLATLLATFLGYLSSSHSIGIV